MIVLLQVFGLHPNADITYQTKTAVDVLNTILNIQPKDSGGSSGETREAVVYRQASEMLEKLPPNYIPHEVYINFPIMLMVIRLQIWVNGELLGISENKDLVALKTLWYKIDITYEKS